MTTNREFPIFSIEACLIALRQRTRLLRHVSREYYELMESEFNSIRGHLPQTFSTILDIGGGLGGIHLFTYRCAANGANINILDRDAIDDRMRYGYRETTEAYNSFDLSRQYLMSGGVPADRITMWDADRDGDIERLSKKKFDAIVSLKSWCFHYPAKTYLDLADRVLETDGVLIVDVRLNTGQEDDLGRKFPIRTVISGDHTGRRLAFRRQ